MIHERLVEEYGFDGTYQRVKLFVGEVRPGILAAAGTGEAGAGLHRRFEVVRGLPRARWTGAMRAMCWPTSASQRVLVPSDTVRSRDPFCCFTTRQDLGMFFDCHRRAFAHFGGVPATLVYDRTKTVVKRHVRPGEAVPVHPQAAAFAEHYGFTIDVLAAYRPTGKGRVERQVRIVREHVLAGRRFDSLAELDSAFTAWLPIRRDQTHRTHGQPIGERAEIERQALRPLPERPYLVAEQHLRRVGKDCLVSFEGSAYSVPAARVQAGMRVAVRASVGTVSIHTLVPDPDGGTLLASIPAPSSTGSGSWTPGTGRACPTGAPARSPWTRPPARPTRRPGRSGRWTRWTCCGNGGPRPRSPPAAAVLTSTRVSPKGVPDEPARR